MQVLSTMANMDGLPMNTKTLRRLHYSHNLSHNYYKVGLFSKLSHISTSKYLHPTSTREVALNDFPDFQVPWHLYLPSFSIAAYFI